MNKNTQKRKQYTLSFKLRVIRFFETHSKNLSATSKEFIVDRKTIRSWIASSASIKATDLKSKRRKIKASVGKNVLFPDMENELHQWIKSIRANGGCIDGRTIQAKALSLVQDKTFTASRGWLLRFLKRKQLSLRRITTKGRQPPNDLRNIVQNFITDAASNLYGIDRKTIFNMDETAIYLDFPSNLAFYAHL
jgi:hypothetical protein